MRRVLNWITSWFATASVVRQLSGSQSHLDRLEVAVNGSEDRLEKRAKELNALAARVDVDIADARRIHRRLEAALDETREQNAVLEKTIQTLVASHGLLLARYDAETAIQVRMKVGASVRE